METIHLFTGFCILVSAGLVAGQIYHIPPVNLATEDSSTCPPDSKLEDARNLIHDQVDNLVPGIIAQFSNNFTVPECGGSGWRRVAFLDMTDPLQVCPDAWRLYDLYTTTRACGRQTDFFASCDSVIFSTGGQPYREVCGRMVGYQYASPDGVYVVPGTSIEGTYVDGISVTHGSPRQHIWTHYAAVWSSRCCSNLATAPFVGEDYFCDTGNPNVASWHGSFFPDHPLWDEVPNCDGADCCTTYLAPWFNVTLPGITTNDIEVRICGNEPTSNEDTPLKLVEIYIK